MIRQATIPVLIGMALLFGNPPRACCSENGGSMDHIRILPMYGAVMHSETEEVRRLAETGQGLNERNPDDQSTPIIAAAETDQWPVVEILIDNGADIWAHDVFGVTAGQYVLTSRIMRGSKEDQARLRVIEKMKNAGYPFPAPDPDRVLALDKAGKWPPPGVKR